MSISAEPTTVSVYTPDSLSTNPLHSTLSHADNSVLCSTIVSPEATGLFIPFASAKPDIAIKNSTKLKI